MQKALIKNKEQVSLAVFFSEGCLLPETLLENLLSLINANNFFPNLKKTFVVLTYSLNEPWNNKEQFLKAIYYIEFNNDSYSINSFSVEPVDSLHLIEKKEAINFLLPGIKATITVNMDKSYFQDFQTQFQNNNHLTTTEPYLFEPLFIPKPWGQEIWFTGVEKRGVSKIKSFRNKEETLPLPWFFSTLPKTLLGSQYASKNLVLVKILDPLPDEVYGDLYYELHTEKNEVYVVTEILAPEGKIKIGASSEKLKFFSNNMEEFKKEFLEKIKSYEKVRKKIDTIFDSYRMEEKIPLNEPVLANKIKEWNEKLPISLKEEEKNKRNLMDTFTGYLNLEIGDVVCVPIHVPHALQHGVRVIEFQTPTYERLIISFAQKVLTQKNWDTDKAFELMEVKVPEKTKLNVLVEKDKYLEELVCSFNEFSSIRVKMEANNKVTLNAQDFYRILFVVTGTISIFNKENMEFKVNNGLCVFLPAGEIFTILSHDQVTYLSCTPK